MADISNESGTRPDVAAAPQAVSPGPAFRVVSHGATDVGRKRDHNEDSYLINAEVGLFVVCDGMGGHAGGGTASKIAVQTIERELAKHLGGPSSPFNSHTPLADSPLPDVLRDAVEAACLAIFRAAQDDPQLQGMGTTCSALVVNGGYAFVGHVGDSRVYLVRGDLIQQISEDHSLVNEQIKAGMITADEARNSRFKNIITRSVGFEEEVAVDVMGLVCEPGDTFIICCDGLSNLVDDRTMRDTVRSLPIDQVPVRLVDLANDAGGDDNITVIAVRLDLR
jgi:serine/threonine protein phosphatase PrpC